MKLEILNWLTVKNQTKIQRHKLVEKNTRWGTQKESALWIRAERCPKALLNLNINA